MYKRESNKELDGSVQIIIKDKREEKSNEIIVSEKHEVMKIVSVQEDVELIIQFI